MCLDKIIEKKRRRMIFLAKSFGLTSTITVKCSQELDKLLNLKQKIEKDKKMLQMKFKKVLII